MNDSKVRRAPLRGSLQVIGGTHAAEQNRAQVDRECIEALEAMLAAAKAGEVIGLAYAVMYRGRHFIVNTAGEMHRNPTFARGAVAALDDELRRMVWGEL